MFQISPDDVCCKVPRGACNFTVVNVNHRLNGKQRLLWVFDDWKGLLQLELKENIKRSQISIFEVLTIDVGERFIHGEYKLFILHKSPVKDPDGHSDETRDSTQISTTVKDKRTLNDRQKQEEDQAPAEISATVCTFKSGTFWIEEAAASQK